MRLHVCVKFVLTVFPACDKPKESAGVPFGKPAPAFEA